MRSVARRTPGRAAGGDDPGMEVLQHELMAEAPRRSAGSPVEWLSRAYQQFNSRTEVPLELFHPDVTYEQPDLMIGTGIYHGHAGLRQALGEMLSSFETFEMRPTDLIYDGRDRLVVRVDVKARGKGSGADVGGRIFHLWTVRNGLIARGRVFLDRNEAINAALEDTPLALVA